MKTVLKATLPVALLLVGIVTSWAIVQSPPVLETTPPKIRLPRVETVPIQPRSIRLEVRSQGTVRASTEVELTAEVSGKVSKVVPSFRAGEFFRESELLVQIDPRDYKLAIVKARAQVAEARSRLLQEGGRSELARKGWQMIDSDEPNPLALRMPQLDEARARLKAAKAVLKAALLRRERTEIRAPFDSLIREKWVGIGEYVEKGDPIARLIAVDKVEVRLPVTLAELAFLDLPLAPRQDLGAKGPKVILRASLARKRYQWEGRIVRTEGVIDEKTRMLYVIAEVQDSYGYLSGSSQAPLLVGLFVKAEIEGRTLAHVSLLPRQALRQGKQVWVATEEGRVSFREVEVLRAKGDWMAVQGDLQRGEMVIVSPLPQAVEGMQVDAERSSILAWSDGPY